MAYHIQVVVARHPDSLCEAIQCFDGIAMNAGEMGKQSFTKNISKPLTHVPNKFIDVSQRLILGVTSAWSPTTDD
jgi:hypothetical protein